jgi:ATP/maltotriose-dependent transcriptional regulator MalT/DNA-binding SARP family transcriptional activator
MNPLSVQPAKIHCPPARDDTLTRDRLNSWLERASDGRLALIVAEAGFGKTTLLADWARHTSRLTAWYRLEPDDRDWLTFIRHLVASVRELDPEFAPATYAMLESLGAGGPTPADLALSIAREMAEWGAATDRGLTLIIDDYHLVDGFAETEPIVRALLERTGPGFSVVIASRSMPRLPLGKLRTRGGVLKLGGTDLRFDAEETAHLFSDKYQRPLDRDVSSELQARTDGWAALLMLVNARLAEGNDHRPFVTQLGTSAGDIYDYIAEEVLAALPTGLTDFLTLVSILPGVDPVSAAIVTGRGREDVNDALAEAERLGLLSRPDAGMPHVFHPLVREFLSARLLADVGEDEVAAHHRRIANATPTSEWYRRAWHFRAAGDRQECESTLDSALESIIAAGDVDLARPFLEPDAGDPRRPTAMMIRSRIESARGDLDRAVKWADAAVTTGRSTDMEGAALYNLATVLSTCGIEDRAVELVTQALQVGVSDALRPVAEAMLALSHAGLDGDLVDAAEALRRLAGDQERAGLRRYAGVSRLNLAGALLWLGDAEEALRESERAERLLGGRERQTVERISATMSLAVAHAQLGHIDLARKTVDSSHPPRSSLAGSEMALEEARLELEFGSASRASRALASVDSTTPMGSLTGLFNLLRGDLGLRLGELGNSRDALGDLEHTRCADAAGRLRGEILAARLALRLRANDPAPFVAARETASLQNTRRGRYTTSLLSAMADDEPLDSIIARTDGDEEYCWSVLAEELAERLHSLSADSLARLEVEAAKRPERWADALRLAIDGGGPAVALAANLLVRVGSWDDGQWLRSMARSRKQLRAAAGELTRRLALPVRIQDLGVVEVYVGSEFAPRSLRRKVMALLCYLAIRPRMAATREEAIEALWPDLDPQAGVNSLHQAIYSLRRVFEPDYREGMSAQYIQFDGDVVSLNSELIETTSRQCWRAIQDAKAAGPAAIDRLLEMYPGKYALTFAYDEWADTYRETLHAAVLAAVEAEIVRSRNRSDYDRAIRLSLAVLTFDGQADAIELELLRAYKASGRHAAAAEQYSHYATLIKDEIGAEPLAFEEL